MSATLDEARCAVSEVLVGQDNLVDLLFVSMLARGNCLLEGVPGVAKTLAVRTFATVLGGSFARLQFTPDLVPSDIVGTRIYRTGQERFDTELGPVFANCVLADEINRAPAKVQAAMLELMAERQVSLGGTTHPLPTPFMVVATQNPVESEGVYPLPEAQRDRFLLKITVPLPGYGDEAEILRRMGHKTPTAHQVLSPEAVLRLQEQAENLYVHPLVADYMVRLVMATRSPQEFGAPDLDGTLQAGVSPRATLGLLAASRALALLRGRDHVLPADVNDLAREVMAHRMLLSFEALAGGATPETLVDYLVACVPEPIPVAADGQPTGNGPHPAPGSPTWAADPGVSHNTATPLTPPTAPQPGPDAGPAAPGYSS